MPQQTRVRQGLDEVIPATSEISHAVNWIIGSAAAWRRQRWLLETTTCGRSSDSVQLQPITVLQSEHAK